MPTLYRLLLPAVLMALGPLPGRVLGQAKPGAAAAPAAPAEGVVFTDNAAVKRALEATVPDIRFDETPLEQALELIRESANVNLLVDWADLMNAGVDRETPMSLHLRNLTLRVALTEVLRQAGGGDIRLGDTVRDGFVRVALESTLRRDVALLDEVRFKDVPLPKVIEFLRAADPSFQVLVAGEPGAAPEQLVISELELRNVTASQVLEALQAAYQQIHVTRTGEDASPIIWTVRVRPTRGPDAEQVTSVFRLREAIDQVQRDMQLEDRVKARGAVLQLLEHALLMNPNHKEPPAVLQLHEATDMLLFRGTQDEMMILRNALAALCPPLKAPASGPRPAETGAGPSSAT